MKKVYWKTYARDGQWWLYLGPDFGNWRILTGESHIETLKKVVKAHPKIKFSPRTWVHTPRMRVSDVVEEMSLSYR